MMTLYSGSTDPYSHRCRIVLFEKDMDFEVIDVDMHNKPEEIASISPSGKMPVLVERDLILTESNIINEYIDERFPHPQLMPPDPVMRARARLVLFNFEHDLFTHVNTLEHSLGKGSDKAPSANFSPRSPAVSSIFPAPWFSLSAALLAPSCATTACSRSNFGL